MARELNAKLENQYRLIAEVMCNMTECEDFDGMELSTPTSGNNDSYGVLINIHNCKSGEIPDEVVWFPDKYLSMTMDELVVEKKRIEEAAVEKFNKEY